MESVQRGGGESDPKSKLFGLILFVFEKASKCPKTCFVYSGNFFLLIYVVVPITTSTRPAKNSSFFLKVPQGIFIGLKIILHYI